MNKNIIQTIRLGAVLGLALFAFTGEVFAAPTLTLVQANSITKTSATLNAKVESPYKTSTVWFEWGESSSLSPMTTVGLNSIYDGGYNGAFFKSDLSNLTPGTTYYYRAVAMEGGTTLYSTPASFKTAGVAGAATQQVVITPGTTGTSAPLAATYGASAISQNSADLNGYIVPNDTNASAWFEWGTASFLGYTTPSKSYGSVATSFNTTLWGLSPNTTYYYRAVTSNSQGISRGSTLSFTTSGSGTVSGTNVSIPSITTNTATAVLENSATLNGYVSPNGSNTSAWFEWGATASFGSTTPSLNYGTNATNYTSTLSNLNATTTYYYRAVANNAQGTVYGTPSSFTTGTQAAQTTVTTTVITTATGGASPEATTLLATESTGTVAKLNGLVFTSADQPSSAWFEWGINSSLGNKTQASNMGTLPVVKLSDTITGLVDGQTYYYRIVAENPYGKVYGTIIHFVSGETSIVRDTTVALGSGEIESTATVKKPTITVIGRGSAEQSLVELSIDGGAEVIIGGEKRSYHIKWKNKEKQSLKNVVLRVVFPQAMNIESATKGSFSSEENAVIVDIKTLASGEEGETFIFATADRRMKEGELAVITANMVYTNTSGVQGDAIAYVTHRVETVTTSALGANLFGSGSFIPTTLLEWILLVVLVLILVLLGNHLYGKFEGEGH